MELFEMNAQLKFPDSNQKLMRPLFIIGSVRRAVAETSNYSTTLPEMASRLQHFTQNATIKAEQLLSYKRLKDTLWGVTQAPHGVIIRGFVHLIVVGAHGVPPKDDSFFPYLCQVFLHLPR